MTRSGVPALVFLVTLTSGCGTEGQPDASVEAVQPPSSQITRLPVGTIRGVVRFEGDPPVPEYDPITENQHVCGDRALLPRLDLGDREGVRNAFVFLDGIAANPPAPLQEPSLVDQRECEYVPHALALPAGSQVVVTNSDSILHNVHGRIQGETGMRTIFNVAQPVQGQRSTINSPLENPGIVFLTCEAGHPWMSAHIFVAEHPYVTVTDRAGEFVIDNVPPGEYTIKMWHEGVRLERIVRNLQRFDYEPPYELTQQVTVEADAEALVDFRFSLRPGN